MTTVKRRWPWWPQLGVAVLIGLAAPYLDLAWKCRDGFEASEACVWAKSYFPLARVLMLVIVTPIAFLVMVGLAKALRRRSV